jgi:hypothetical protein
MIDRDPPQIIRARFDGETPSNQDKAAKDENQTKGDEQ